MSGRRLISGRQALGVEYDMRNALYAKLLRLSFGFYDRHQTGQLLSRATVDLQTVRFFLGYGLVFFFQNVLTIVAATAIMFFVNWRARARRDRGHAADRRLRVPLLERRPPGAPRRAAEDGRRRDRRRGEHRRRPRRQVVRAGAERARQVLRPLRSASSHRSVDANKQRALYVPLLSFLPLIMQAGVLLVGGRMVANGTLDLGTFFFFNVLVVMLVMPLRMLGMWVGQSQRATASGERIFEVMDEPEEIVGRSPTRRRCRRATAAFATST